MEPESIMGELPSYILVPVHWFQATCRGCCNPAKSKFKVIVVVTRAFLRKVLRTRVCSNKLRQISWTRLGVITFGWVVVEYSLYHLTRLMEVVRTLAYQSRGPDFESMPRLFGSHTILEWFFCKFYYYVLPTRKQGQLTLAWIRGHDLWIGRPVS